MTTADRAPESVLDNHIEPFINHLRAAGYAERTLRKKQTVARAFSRWAKRKRAGIDDLNDEHVTEFIVRSPRRCREHVRSELAAMRLFVRYLRAAGTVQSRNPSQNVSVAADLLCRYEDFLRRDRGLAENSVHVYSPFIRTFLAAHSTETGCLTENAWDSLTIRDFLIAQTLFGCG
jgi:site-specific recombinase XerD